MSHDETDHMCPNCQTPWKCNGPHLTEQTPYYLDGRAAIQHNRDAQEADLLAALAERNIHSRDDLANALESSSPLFAGFPSESFASGDEGRTYSTGPNVEAV